MAKVKECIICKKMFKKTGRNQKCCSKECSKRMYKNHAKEYELTNRRQQYLQSEKYKLSHKISNRKYNQSEKGRKYLKQENVKRNNKKYEQSEKGKQTLKINRQKYRATKKFKQYLKEYRQTRSYKEYQKSWRKTLKGKLSELNKKAKRKERKNNSIHQWGPEQWKRKCEACNGICPICNKPFDNYLHKISLDHILALYWANEYFKATGKKWVYTIDGIEPICLKCNITKGNKLIWNFK